MFPHATCLCIKREQTESIHVHEQQCDIHLQAKNKKLTPKYPWIIRSNVDFIEISVLSQTQELAILQPHQPCHRQVSWPFFLSNRNNNESLVRGDFIVFTNDRVKEK